MVGGEPGEALVEAIPGGGTGRLHVPVPVPDSRQPQFFLNFVRFHGCKTKQEQYFKFLGDRGGGGR